MPRRLLMLTVKTIPALLPLAVSKAWMDLPCSEQLLESNVTRIDQ